MIMEENTAHLERAAALLAAAGYTVALTGAGVSTASGIPDFRSPGSGIWNTVNPEVFTIGGFKADPGAIYRQGAPFFRQIESAEPNEAHLALARLEQHGLLKAIITQNVDGLHQRAGSERVLEIHGSLQSAGCLHCGRQVPLAEAVADVEEGLVPPLCAECGEPLKPGVVLFGEPLPPAFQEAKEEVRRADLLLVAGTGLQVAPANELPALCDDLVIINRTPTFYDRQARVVIHSEAAPALSGLLAALENRLL